MSAQNNEHADVVSAAYIALLFRHLEREKQTNIRRMLGAIGLERSTLEEPDAMIPMSRYLALLDHAARYCHDDNLGLHIYQGIDFTDIGVFGYALLNSRTVGDALRLSSRYYCLLQTNAELKLKLEGEFAHFSYRINSSSLQPSRQDSEVSTAFAVILQRHLLDDSQWRPEATHFQHSAPTNLDEHYPLFGDKIIFNQPSNKIIFSSSLLQATVSGADTKLSQSLQATMSQLLKQSRLSAEDEMLQSIQEQIIRSLNEGIPSIENLAGQLAISPRTLQRRLAKSGKTFKEIVEDIRAQLSLKYLQQPELSLIDIAFMLGYSELSSFNRAFRRWTDIPPSEYRKSLA